MSNNTRALGTPRVAVKVKRIGATNKYQIEPGISMLDGSTLVMERDEAKIIDDNGEEMMPSGRFLWTTETIDPYHLVVDMF